MLDSNPLNQSKRQIYFSMKSKVFSMHSISKPMNGTKKETVVYRIIISYNKFQESQGI